MWHERNNFFLRCAIMTPISRTLSPVDYQPILIFLHNILFFQIIIKFRRVLGFIGNPFGNSMPLAEYTPSQGNSPHNVPVFPVCRQNSEYTDSFQIFSFPVFSGRVQKSVFITEFCIFIGHRMSCQLDFFGIQSRITHHIGQLQKHLLHLNYRKPRRFLNPVRHCKTRDLHPTDTAPKSALRWYHRTPAGGRIPRAPVHRGRPSSRSTPRCSSGTYSCTHQSTARRWSPRYALRCTFAVSCGLPRTTVTGAFGA